MYSSALHACMHVVVSVLCLSLCQSDNIKNIKRISTKICNGHCHCPRTDRLNFGKL